MKRPLNYMNNPDDGLALNAANRAQLTARQALELDIADRMQSLRESYAKKILQIFVLTNVTVLVLIVLILILEWAVNHGNKTQIITEGVLMALIGATTIQVGAISLSIALYLFPRDKEDLEQKVTHYGFKG